MQCFLIFDHLNDVIYYKQNYKFFLYIRKRCVKDGLLHEEDDFSRPGTLDYNNALVQLFSPLVASQRIMIGQFNSPYSGITCQDGTTFAFTEYLSYILVAIGRESHVTETFLKKKLAILLRLATFLCGPTLDILRPPADEFHERRDLLGRLLDSWDALYKKDLPFRLEAHERLLTNSDLSSKWVKLLQNVLEKLRNGISEVTACHAFILIKTRVLAVYSSRNAGSVSDGDLLLLVLLSTAYTNEVLPADHVEKTKESLTSSDSEQYFSPCASPGGVPSNSTGGLSSGSEELLKEVSNIKIEEDGEDHLRTKMYSEVDLADGYVDISIDFKSNWVFFQTSLGTLAPYVVNYVNIADGITLVTISAVNKHVLSSSLVSGIETLHSLQNIFVNSPANATLELLESNIRNIVESLKKLKTDDKIDGIIRRVRGCWETTKKSGLLDYLKCKDQDGMPSRLEVYINQLSSYLKLCFKKYCIGCYRKEMCVNGSLIDAQALVRYTLADYVEYLRVKGDQNITMANYYADFAGMVHFIFVDRSNNQVLVPSVDVLEKTSHNYFSKKQDSVYKKLCYMVDKAWTHLLKGHTTVIWRDDCYHYSYYLWFEDSVGNPCRPLVPCSAIEGVTQPGIIATNYYKQLVQTCFPSSQEFIRCYELYCLHLATVPPVIINNHARRLISKIWELSGAAQSPVDLLL